MPTLFRNNPAIAWMIGILGIFILLPLAYAGIKNWGIVPPAAPVVDTWEFVWLPFFKMLFWALIPALFIVLCILAYWRVKNIAITTTMEENMAVLGIYIYLTVFIVAMIANLFGPTPFNIVLALCRGFGVALLILVGLGLFITYMFPILLGLFGNRVFFAILAAFIIFWLLFIPSCSHIISKWSNWDKELMKRAKEKRTVVIEEPVEIAKPERGKGNVIPNQNFQPEVVNQGDNNQTIQKDEGDVIIIYGKQKDNSAQSGQDAEIGTDLKSTAEDLDE